MMLSNGKVATMPDKKLTDNEIVKALECCVLAKHICPHTCPMLKNKECLASLRKYALDIINRLQAENENYSKNNQQMTKDILDLYKALEQAKAKNERLKEVNDSFTDIGKLYSEIKAEAYKEFAERLKEKITEEYNYFEEQEYPRARIKDIDNLLKELVGE